MTNARKGLLIPRLAASCVALAGSFLCPSAGSATYVFTTIDYPGALFTDVRGVNNNGQIVGYASFDTVHFFTFVYSGGAFTRLPAGPSGEDTAADGINDPGAIVGTAEAFGIPGVTQQAFIYDSTGYRFHVRPGATNSYFRAINALGLTTGYSETFAAEGTWLGGTGFIFDPVSGTYTDISVPDAMLVIAQGINTAGTVVGSGQSRPGGSVAFVRDASGAQTYFQVSGLSTKARGINNAGLITGFVEVAGEVAATPIFTFVGTPPDQHNIAIDGMQQTVGEGINDSGQVVGLFNDSAWNTHGFLATPAELPMGTTSGGGFAFSVPVEAYTPVYIDPQVALGYLYEVGKNDPSFATVRLPIGIGDSRYTIIVDGHAYPIAGGELFDFERNAHPGGVRRFRVTDIEMDAALDPVNPHAFPTQLTFTEAGRFSGTMTALCLPGPIPPRAGDALRRALGRCTH